MEHLTPQMEELRLMTTMLTSGSASSRNISYGTSIHNYHQDSPKTDFPDPKDLIIAQSERRMLLVEIVLTNI